VEHTVETRRTTAKLLKSLIWLGDLDTIDPEKTPAEPII
jgi:hypothetical protein